MFVSGSTRPGEDAARNVAARGVRRAHSDGHLHVAGLALGARPAPEAAAQRAIRWVVAEVAAVDG